MKTVTACGVTFRLNKPNKWTAYSILRNIEEKGYEYITPTLKLTKASGLREVIEAANHLEDKANRRA